MVKNNRTTKNILMLAALAVLVYLLFNMNGKSAYTLKERDFMEIEQVGPGPAPAPMMKKQAAGCQMNAGTGLASWNRVSKSDSLKRLVVPCVTRTSNSELTRRTRSNRTCGTTRPSSRTRCSVICAK
jgi:hypothetical protein